MYRKIMNLILKKREQVQLKTRQKIFTSISDNQRYPQACLDAANSYETFNQFRRMPAYVEILEHVTPELGTQYLQLLNDPIILNLLSEIRRNDDLGDPMVFDFSEIGFFSPTTLRYAKVLQDLTNLYKSLNGMNICEIGVGYGGQCRVISTLYRPAKYTLVDLKPALQLTQRFLDNFAMPTQLVFLTMNESPYLDNVDLVISNYAFTELPRIVQDIYFEKIISQAKHGYITYNEITPPEFHSYNRAELLQKIPGARVIPEVPLTHEKNCIISW